MTFVLLALLVCTVWKMKPVKGGGFNPDYISKEQTTAINGVFVVCDYHPLGDIRNAPAKA